MKFFYLFLFLLAITLVSCFPTKQVNELKYYANSAMEAGDYISSLDIYKKIIQLHNDRNRDVESDIYLKAGLVAWKLNETSKTIDFLEKAKSDGDRSPEVYYILSKAYLEIDNLSREITNLEEYVDNYPQGMKINEAQNQLFIAYVKSRNWQLAAEMWPKVNPHFREQSKTLTARLKLLAEQGKDKESIDVARKVIALDAQNILALEVLAQGYYQKAEENYTKEMRAYEQNRTMRQYRQLLKELEIINANFRTSRDYFEKLYELDPNPRYANFLGNIYTRFDNKQRAEYFYRKARGE